MRSPHTRGTLLKTCIKGNTAARLLLKPEVRPEDKGLTLGPKLKAAFLSFQIMNEAVRMSGSESLWNNWGSNGYQAEATKNI